MRVVFLALTLGFAAPLLAADREAPPGPNPYLAWLPAGADPHWAYWRERLSREAGLRRQQRASLALSLEVAEAEPPGVRETNDLPVFGEALPAIGARVGQSGEVTIRGHLLAEPPLVAVAAEPDGAIPTAVQLPVGPAAAAAASGTIGDGEHGSGGSGSGDYDVFRISATAGARIEVSVRTPEPLAGLNPIAGLYDAAGTRLAANDDRPANGILSDLDSYFAFTAPATADYFVVVGGFAPGRGEEVADMLPADPFDPTSGPGAFSEGPYTLNVGLDAPGAGDRDFFQLELVAGDLVGATLLGSGGRLSLTRLDGEELVASNGPDLSALYPLGSPLPGGGSASLAYLVAASGLYALGVEAPLGFDRGAYEVEARVARPGMEGDPSPRRQILYLDFDGATVDPRIFGSPRDTATLSPFSSFLAGWGFAPQEELALVVAIAAVVEENLEADLRARGANGDFAASGIAGEFDVEIRTPFDGPDPFGQPDVSRVIVGGTIEELGLTTIGIAEAVDPGNFASGETAVVLLDLLSGPPDDPNSLNNFLLRSEGDRRALVAVALGNVVAHEAGHLFGNFHTARDVGEPNLMDRGGNLRRLAGAGEDRLFGTPDDVDVDFGASPYEPAEAFTGTEHTLDTISFGLPAGGPRREAAAAPLAHDFGAVPPGEERFQAFVLSNEGNSTLSGLATVAGDDAYSSGDGGPFTLAPAASRELVVRFAPTSGGTNAAMLRITSDDPAQPLLELPLAGQGGVPAASLDDTGHDFGPLEYDGGLPTASRGFTLANAGPGELHVAGLERLGPDPAQFTANLAAGDEIVPPGGSAEIEVSFAPRGPVGSMRATLAVRTNDPLAPRLDISLAGAANGPDFNFFPSQTFAYGAVRVGTTRDRIFIVDNRGNRDLVVAGATLAGDDADLFSFGTGAPPFVLAPGESRQLVVTFSPLSLGFKRALLAFDSNDPDESPFEVALFGEGAEPDLRVDPLRRDFGPVAVGGTVSKRVFLFNEGTSRLTVQTTEILGPDAESFHIATGEAPFTISADSFWVIRLLLSPTTAGPKNAILRIVSDDPDTPIVDVTMDGTATLPAPPPKLPK